MKNNQKLQHGDYEYQIVSYKTLDGRYQGMILLIAHAGIPYSPIVEIPTPTTLKSEHAAQIEASALACELIETGAVAALSIQHGKADSWPKEPQNPF